MGQYMRGDVVIAPVTFQERDGAKIRPAVVIASGLPHEVYLCPVSRKRPSDTPCVTISLDDFSEGGLDLFDESYVLTSRIFMIQSGEIIGKRGRLTTEAITSITMNLPLSLISGNNGTKGTNRSRSLR